MSSTASPDMRPDWLSSAPAHWKIAPIKVQANLCNGATPLSSEENFWDGDIPWATPVDLGNVGDPVITDTSRKITAAGHASCGTTLVPVGSIIVSTRAPIGSLGIAGVPTCFNQGCRGLIPLDGVHGKFLYYTLNAYKDVLQAHGEGTTFKELSSTKLANLDLAWPAIDEQVAIAAFLDDETARIDCLLSEKAAFLSVLQEMRGSAVTHAITSGIRRNRTLKASGLTWVDAIPKDWQTVPLKRIVRLIGGHTPATGNPTYWDGDVPWFSPKDMKHDELFDSIDHVTRLAVEEAGLSVIEPDTTLIVVRGMILAHTFPVCVSRVAATINQDMKALLIDEAIAPSYLPWLLRGVSPLFLSLTEQSAHGTMALRTDRFMSEPLPIPPLNEQCEIAEFLLVEREKLGQLSRHVEAEMQLLRELRSTTISDAVLGRIDLCGCTHKNLATEAVA